MNISNILFQIAGFANPLSDKHVKMNIVYTFCSLLSLMSVWYGMKHLNKNLTLVAYQILLFRNILRLMDLEDLCDVMDTYSYVNVIIL